MGHPNMVCIISGDTGRRAQSHLRMFLPTPSISSDLIHRRKKEAMTLPVFARISRIDNFTEDEQFEIILKSSMDTCKANWARLRPVLNADGVSSTSKTFMDNADASTNFGDATLVDLVYIS